MPAKLYSVALEGIDGIICEVDVDVAGGNRRNEKKLDRSTGGGCSKEII